MWVFMKTFLTEKILPKVLPWVVAKAPELIEKEITKFFNKKESTNMINIKVTKDEAGNGISSAKVSYAISGVAQSGTTDANGLLVVAGLAAGDYTFAASATGYDSKNGAATVIEGQNQNLTIQLTATATSTQTVESAVETAANTVTTAVNTAISTTTATNVTDAKAAYKDYMAELETEMSAIKTAISSDALDSVSSQSADFISNVKTKLTASIGWYVEQRSKLKASNGTIAAKNWVAYLEYTSMIGAMYLMRGTVSTFVDTVLEYIESKIK